MLCPVPPPSFLPVLALLVATSVTALTCIDRLPSDKAALLALLQTPPSNVSIAGLHFGEQRMFYGTPFRCNGTITRVTFAATSSSTGSALPELGVWNEFTPFNQYTKSAGLQLSPCLTGELEVEVEGGRQRVEIHEVVPDQPLPVSSSQWPAVFLPENASYALQLYLFNVTDVPIINEMSYLSFFQRRSVVQTNYRIVVVNGGNLLPLMALEICPDDGNTSCGPTDSVSCLGIPSPSPSPSPAASPSPPAGGLSTAAIVLVAVLPSTLLLLVCASALATSIICCTCCPGRHKHHHNFPNEGHLDNGIPVSEMENNGLYEQPVVPESKPSHVLTVLNDTYKMEDEGAAYEQPIFHTQPNEKHTYSSIAGQAAPPLPPNHPSTGSPSLLKFAGRLSPNPILPPSPIVITGAQGPPPLYHTLELSRQPTPATPGSVHSISDSPVADGPFSSKPPPGYYHSLEHSPQGSPTPAWTHSGGNTPINRSRTGSLERLLADSSNQRARLDSKDHLDAARGSMDHLRPDSAGRQSSLDTLRFHSVGSPGSDSRAESPDYHILDVEAPFNMDEGIFVPTQEQRHQFTLSQEPLFDDTIYASFKNDPKSPLPQGNATFFPDEDLYWRPARDTVALFQQLASKKYREILRRNIKMTEHLGSGEFGTVCQGEWYSHKGRRDVAVKMLNQQALEKDKVRFLQEAAIMGQFKHPNIVRLHGVVTIGVPVIIVLELMKNGNLRNYLRSLRPSSEEMLPLDLQQRLLEFSVHVSLGMEYLARKEFIHRDLAARNVLLSQDCVCKIADFGMSRDLDDETYYISQGGKIPIKWTAPEALNYRKYSSASDVWSFGVLLYEVWSLGHTPFKSCSADEAMERVTSGYRLPPPPGCPKALYRLMIQCWHPEASQRPSFTLISKTLKEVDANTLKWSMDDIQVHPKASTLGAPLEAALHLFPELQRAYIA